jgi:hypothetical protein
MATEEQGRAADALALVTTPDTFPAPPARIDRLAAAMVAWRDLVASDLGAQVYRAFREAVGANTPEGWEGFGLLVRPHLPAAADVARDYAHGLREYRRRYGR